MAQCQRYREYLYKHRSLHQNRPRSKKNTPTTARIVPASVAVMYKAARRSCPGLGWVIPTPQMKLSLTSSVKRLIANLQHQYGRISIQLICNSCGEITIAE
jgi:hypothetical protein